MKWPLFPALLLFSALQAQTPDTLWTRDLSSMEAFSTCFSPSGDKLAVAYACEGPMVRVFDTYTGDVLWASPTPDLCLYAVQFSSNGKYIAIAEELGHLTVFDMDSLEQVYNIDTQTGGLYSVDFTPDGSVIAAGCIDGTIRLYETATGAFIHSIPAHTEGVLSIDISPDGAWLMSASKDNTARLWRMNGYSLERTFSGHLDDVKSVKFTPGMQRIITCSADDDVKVWNPWTGQCDTTLLEHWADVNTVDVASDETFFATGSHDMSIKLHDLFDYHLIASLTNNQQTRVYGVSISPDRTRLAAAIQSGAVFMWNLAGTVGVPETEGVSVQYYPNPCTDWMQLSLPAEGLAWQVMDMSGKTVMAGAQTNRLYTTNLPPGLYVLRYTLPQGKQGYLRFVRL